MSTIAVIGASSVRKKFGNKCVRAYQAAGWTVFPINPTDQTIEGLKVYRNLAELPVDFIDRVSFYLPPSVGVKVAPELAAKKVSELWLNPGTESPEIVAIAESLGVKPVRDCSIVDIGYSPSQFPDE